jgi:small subunit ribosomal protein S9
VAKAKKKASQGVDEGPATAVETEPETELETEIEEEAAEPLWYWGTGRRKTAVARVRIRPGSGEVRVNKKPVDVYFTIERHCRSALTPLQTSKLEGRVDVFANISGGGPTGQAEAMLMGLARALVKLDPAVEPALRLARHLTRDSRMVERKKYGRRGARRRFQYSKR